MKSALVIFSIFLTQFASAASVTISSDQAVSGDLSTIPQQFISLLRDTGVPFKHKVGGDYSIGIKNFHCDHRSNAALDPRVPEFDLGTTRCRINSDHVQDSHVGTRFLESHGLLNILDQIESAPSSLVYFTDCGMGYCGTDFKSATCTIHMTIDGFYQGRGTCTFVDMQ
jgi:hypothetical protein